MTYHDISTYSIYTYAMTDHAVYQSRRADLLQLKRNIEAFLSACDVYSTLRDFAHATIADMNKCESEKDYNFALCMSAANSGSPVCLSVSMSVLHVTGNNPFPCNHSCNILITILSGLL